MKKVRTEQLKINGGYISIDLFKDKDEEDDFFIIEIDGVGDY